MGDACEEWEENSQCSDDGMIHDVVELFVGCCRKYQSSMDSVALFFRDHSSDLMPWLLPLSGEGCRVGIYIVWEVVSLVLIGLGGEGIDFGRTTNPILFWILLSRYNDIIESRIK